MIRGYTTPPYPQDVVVEKQVDADRYLESATAKLVDEIDRVTVADTWNRQRWTLWGLLVIAVGSGLQGLGGLVG
jgi:hypothetical protein